MNEDTPFEILRDYLLVLRAPSAALARRNQSRLRLRGMHFIETSAAVCV
jgi:hypothetical protein